MVDSREASMRPRHKAAENRPNQTQTVAEVVQLQ